ncbi:hypothetical protein B6U82_00285 [Candidatus Pacearchaeota archaeon ex4484_31]|nr:MAG: hypothetical protein B6U82_00285 [Candidatus Pacearchaeota archaeon ex4484_31]
MEQKKVWDAIAEQWYHFRQKPFRDIAKELEKLSEKEKGKILEIGCGNCRNLLVFAKKGFECYGLDFSEKMLEFAKLFYEKHKIKVRLKLGVAEKLPYQNNFFDYCLSISLLHHLETKEKRRKAVEEMFRVLKPNGLAFVSVWNLFPLSLFVKNKMVKWQKEGKVFYRYYYLFLPFELKNLLRKAGFKVLRSSKLFGKNIWFLAKKLE